MVILAPVEATCQGRLAFDSTGGPIRYDPNTGLALHAPGGRQQLRLRFWIQQEFRTTADDPSPSVFTIRRSRAQLEAQLVPGLGFRLTPEFAGARVFVEDAFADLTVSSALWFRAGRQRVPFGAERERLIIEQAMPERSVASQLTANRDVGLTASGELLRQRFEYTVGLLNGVPDNLSASTDVNDAKDLSLRVAAWPVRHGAGANAQGVRIGAAVMTGVQSGTALDAQLPSYGTGAGATWFAYAAPVGVQGPVHADGRRTRSGAFLAAHEGPIGLLTEVLGSRQTVRTATARAALTHWGWSATGMWVVSGGRSAPGGVTPTSTFDPSAGQWGALQLVVRGAQLHVDEAAFAGFADRDASASRATSWGGGVNWFLTRYSKVQLAVETVRYVGGAPDGGRRPSETSLWVRSQLTL